MYLTKFPICMGRRKAMQMVHGRRWYDLHAAVEASFPPGANESSEGRLLWRVDEGRGGGAVLYVLSPSKPCMVGLDEQIGWPDLDPQWETVDYGPMLAKVKTGKIMRFSLTANACKENHDTNRRVPMSSARGALDWLGNPGRVAATGIEPVADTVVVTSLITKSVMKGDSKPFPLFLAGFNGLMRITDEEKARRAICMGIGRSRGFGAGLMLIASR